MKRYVSRGGGFTLVEVLLAVTLLTLILSVTVSGLRTFGNTQNSLERVINRVDEIRAVSTFLRNAFAATVVTDLGALTLGGDTGIESSYFRMIGGDEVEWRSTAMFGEDYGGSYFFRAVAREKELILQWQVAKDRVPKDWEKAASRVLIKDLQDFQLSCRTKSDKSWSKVWDKVDAIPDRVRVSMRSSDRYWPDLIIKVGG